jgi:hypothetical protein
MMVKRVLWLTGLIAALMMASTALAQGPRPQHSDPNWQATYWNNTTLSGSPVFERSEAELNHDWGTGSPDPSVSADRFSAHWFRYIEVSPGLYRFTATSDDGMRVWVNGELIIDEWYDHAPMTVSVDKNLGEGHHLVQVEFYENTGGAVAKVSWAPVSPPVTGWHGEYFDNTTLSGTPAVVRDDPYVDFKWGTGPPATGVGADGFSVRWTRDLDLPAGMYRFTATVDDGGRLWVNNHLLIDAWKEQPATTYTGDIYLPGGAVPVKMEYYEQAGLAVAQLSWVEVDTPPVTDWRGEYFDNTTLSGTPTVVRDDPYVNLNWGTGSPAPGIGVDGFSVRWTRDLDLATGTYRFTVTVDDGVRLWVNNQLLIDAWKEQPATTYTTDIYLPGGAVPVKMEYYEQAGLAVAQLSWAKVDSEPPEPETVIVDDTDAGFVKGGSATGWRTEPEGYAGHLTWTWNNDWEWPSYNWARWHPSLKDAWYEVFVYIPERFTTTSNARYWIAHADGFTLRVVNQSASGSRWVSLGTYRFESGGADYVSLSDVTYESRLSRLVGFDAMKWVPR